MQIGPSNYSSVINSVAQIKKATIIPQQFTDSKKALRDVALKYVSDLNAAKNETGDDNPRVQQIMEKFKSGKKLSPSEMDYIVREAPGKVDYINKVTREREMIEQSMRIAGSKFDVGLVVSQSAKTISKSSSSEEVEVRMRHLLDAYNEYQKTDEYKEKPDLPNASMPSVVLPFSQSKMLDAYDKKEQKPFHQLHV